MHPTARAKLYLKVAKLEDTNPDFQYLMSLCLMNSRYAFSSLRPGF